MAYVLSIHLSQSGPDQLLLVDAAAPNQTIALGVIGDSAIEITTPQAASSAMAETLDYPGELVDDDMPVHLDDKLIGTGFDALVAAVGQAIDGSPFGGKLTISGITDGILTLDSAPLIGSTSHAAGSQPSQTLPGLPQATPAPSSGTTPVQCPDGMWRAARSFSESFALMTSPGAGTDKLILTPLGSSGLPAIQVGDYDATANQIVIDLYAIQLSGIPLNALPPLALGPGAPVPVRRNGITLTGQRPDGTLSDALCAALCNAHGMEVDWTVCCDQQDHAASQSLGTPVFTFDWSSWKDYQTQINGTSGLAPTFALPQRTPAGNLQSISQMIASGATGTPQAPLTTDWVLMQMPHPNGLGQSEAIVICPANANIQGLPAYMIGEYDATTGDGTIDGTFMPLSPGLALAPLRLPAGITHFSGTPIDDTALEWVLRNGLGHMVHPGMSRFANLTHDPQMSANLGAAIYHAAIGPGSGNLPGSGLPGGGAAPGGASSAGPNGTVPPGSAPGGSAPAGAGSTLPDDAELPEAGQALADLAAAATSNPRLLEKLAGIAGLEQEVKKLTPKPDKPAPPAPLFGGWS